MKCPRCTEAPELTARELMGVVIDYCTRCRGVWLDMGELETLSGLDPVGEDPTYAINIALQQMEEYRKRRART